MKLWWIANPFFKWLRLKDFQVWIYVQNGHSFQRGGRNCSFECKSYPSYSYHQSKILKGIRRALRKYTLAVCNFWTVCPTDLCLTVLEMAENFQITMETCLHCPPCSAGPDGQSLCTYQTLASATSQSSTGMLVTSILCPMSTLLRRGFCKIWGNCGKGLTGT